MNSTRLANAAELSSLTVQVVRKEDTMSATELISGAQSASTVRAWAEYKNLDLASAKQIISTAVANKQIGTNSGRLITRTVEDAYADDKVCYTYRMLGTLTEQFSKTSHTKQVISAALFIHTALFAPKEQAKNKARKTDGAETTQRVRTSRTTQDVNATRKISIDYVDTEELFIQAARDAWTEHTAKLVQEAQNKRNAQITELASSLNTAAAAAGISVAELVALAQKMGSTN